MDLGAVEEELASLRPELPETEPLLVLVVQARALHFQPKSVKVGLAHIPQAWVGPGPREGQGLSLVRIHRCVRGEALLHLPLFVEHVRDDLNRTRLLDATQLHVHGDGLFLG